MYFLNKIYYPANCIKKNIILKGIDITNPINSTTSIRPTPDLALELPKL